MQMHATAVAAIRIANQHYLSASQLIYVPMSPALLLPIDTTDLRDMIHDTQPPRRCTCTRPAATVSCIYYAARAARACAAEWAVYA
jgi:hypothetical protein